jgi:hypothetical protein
MIHVNQDVAALRQLDDGIVGTAVTGATDRSLADIDAESQTHEIRLDVLRMADGDLPSVAADHRAHTELRHLRRRTPARQLAASRLELILTIANSRRDCHTVKKRRALLMILRRW